MNIYLHLLYDYDLRSVLISTQKYFPATEEKFDYICNSILILTTKPTRKYIKKIKNTICKSITITTCFKESHTCNYNPLHFAINIILIKLRGEEQCKSVRPLPSLSTIYFILLKAINLRHILKGTQRRCISFNDQTVRPIMDIV